MLRLRSKNGETKELDENFQFVELTDVDGKVAIVLYSDPRGGVGQIIGGTVDADRYKQWFKVDFCPIINVEV